jgi:hypothetical protein
MDRFDRALSALIYGVIIGSALFVVVSMFEKCGAR